MPSALAKTKSSSMGQSLTRAKAATIDLLCFNGCGEGDERRQGRVKIFGKEIKMTGISDKTNTSTPWHWWGLALSVAAIVLALLSWFYLWAYDQYHARGRDAALSFLEGV